MRSETGGWKSLIALAWLAIPSLCTAYDHFRPVPTDICEYRTVNYITHGLPQQCLRTSWTSQPVASLTSAAATSSAPPPPIPPPTTTEELGEKQQQVESKEEEEPGKPGIIGHDGRDQEDLATSSFMSFEEWKEMMLRKSGQDPAAIKGHKPLKEPKAHRESGDGHADLDSLGDDGEISIDFGALSDKVSELTAAQSDRPTPEASVEVREEQVLLDDGKMQYYRSKDAGTTCKERFSYSSFDAGSTIKKTSPGAKNAKSILVENKDSYMLMECHTKNKFVIVELSDDILVDTVVLANFEFFSSMIRKFRVSVSDRYPVKLDKWIELGTFEARNSRDIQAFMIEHPQIYTKYIRIEFLTHYGNEYYCPVSLLRVHGTRMLDSWKEPDTVDEPEPSSEPVSQQEQQQEYQDVRQEQTETATRTSEPIPPVQTNNTVAVQESSHQPDYVGVSPWPNILGNATLADICVVDSPVTDSPTPVTPMAEPVDGGASSSIAGRQTSTPPPSSTPSHASQTKFSTPATTATERSPALSPSTSSASSSPVPPKESLATPKTSTTGANAKQQEPTHKTNFTEPLASSVKPPSSNPSSSATQAAIKVKTSITTSAPASPTVQESFFKAVTKRLQHLESNTSLSMQYIEEQSRFLQEALRRMEKRQISRVDAFLDSLNNTVFTELRNVRAQYDQIWQSTVIALESQRDQSQRETVALSERLSLLADEVVFQKRMAILQSVLLLAALVLVIFSRGYYVNNPPVDLLGHQPRFSFQSHNYRNSMSAPVLADSPPRHLGDDLDPDADYSAPSPSPKRQESVSSRRTLSRTASYNDKVLPLTPDSKSASEAGTREVTPAIHVVDTDTPFFYSYKTLSASQADDRQRQDGTLSSDGSEPLNSTESTPNRKWEEGRTSEDSDPPQDADILMGSPEWDRTQHQAKVLSRRVGGSQSGSTRKPLPALPEDMPEDDEPSLSYEK